jgi:putative phage-type endonuclease
MLTAEQLALRCHSIGGSDAAAIVGLSPFKTHDDLLLEKAGLKEPDTDERYPQHKLWGSILEPHIRDHTATELGLFIASLSQQTHPDYPFLTAQVDGIIVKRLSQGGDNGVYEGKCTAHSQKAKWKDGPPPEYYIQVCHNLLVTGLTWAVIAVLIGGNDYRRFEIQRNEEDIALLLAHEIRFWNKVQQLRKEHNP